MKQNIKDRILDEIQKNSNILYAAITGSATSVVREDEFSDIDLLLVSGNKAEIENAASWLPREYEILLQEKHLSYYQTIILTNFEKIDVSVFSVED